MRAVGPRAGVAQTLGLLFIPVLLLAACSGAPAAHSLPSMSVTSRAPAATDLKSTSSAGDEAASCIRSILQPMSVPDRAGQVLMVGVPSSAPQAAADLVTSHHVGGVFLDKETNSSARRLRAGIDRIQAAARGEHLPGVLTSVDQEGGNVQRLSGHDFPALPTALKQGTWTPEQLRGRSGAAARALRTAGITMNLAPVADTVATATARQNAPIGRASRQFGSVPLAVGSDVSIVVKAFQDQHVLATLKHFPGLGRVRVNTDYAAGAIDTQASRSDPNLAPFNAGILAGSAAVMISSASYPGLDKRNIAMFSSPIIQKLLRARMGFTGLVISDDVGSAVALSSVPRGARAVRFVAAGGDMVLTNRGSDAPIMTSALIREASRSPVFRTRLDDAARHVLEAKYQVGLLVCS